MRVGDDCDARIVAGALAGGEKASSAACSSSDELATLDGRIGVRAAIVVRDTAAMNWVAHLIASGDMDDHSGGTNYVPFLLIGAAVVVAVLVQRSRVQKAKARVNVSRMHDAGRVALDRLPDSHSLAVGVRVHPDHSGTQTLLEGAT